MKIVTFTLVILDHDHLITIEIEIVQENYFHAISFGMYETTLIHFWTKNKRTTQHLTWTERKRKVIQKNHF